MMNLLALSLVVTSLAAAGVWSPSPEKQKHGVDVIVKEVHRTIVVEYDQHGQPITEQKHANNMVEDAKEKLKEASSHLPNLGQGLSQTSDGSSGKESSSHVFPNELICDALGKCKHRIASAMGKAKETVSEVAREAMDETKERVREVGETAGHALGKAKETVSQKAHEAIDETKERAHEVGEAAGHAIGKAKETVSKQAHGVEERAKESVKDAMDKVKEAKDIGRTMGEDIAKNVTDKVEKAKEEVVEKAKESKKELSGIFGRGRQVGRDAVKYVKWPEVMGVVNLLGFASAYGMCMWVTFISSYVLAGAMTRQQFGIVQSKIYPVYFRAMACSIGLAFLAHVLGNRKRMFSRTVEMLQAYNLLASLLMVSANALYLEPRATKVL